MTASPNIVIPDWTYNCNGVTATLSGTENFYSEVMALQTANSWIDQDLYDFATRTDGYRI